MNYAVKARLLSRPGREVLGAAAAQFDGRFALSAERALLLDGVRLPVLASELPA